MPAAAGSFAPVIMENLAIITLSGPFPAVRRHRFMRIFADRFRLDGHGPHAGMYIPRRRRHILVPSVETCATETAGCKNSSRYS
jgi:hypothetical protein